MEGEPLSDKFSSKRVMPALKYRPNEVQVIFSEVLFCFNNLLENYIALSFNLLWRSEGNQ